MLPLTSEGAPVPGSSAHMVKHAEIAALRMYGYTFTAVASEVHFACATGHQP